tara:strand:+ start:104928 stop:105389 length:462 start_codon:yes stop_codon:yes gene_type:complete
MKQIIILVWMFFGLFAQAQSTDYSKLDNAKGTSMKPILALSETVREVFEEKMEIVRMEFDIVSSSSSITYRTLYKDIDYIVFAFGDFRVKDLDIKLFHLKNEEWVQVDKDNDERSSASVKIRPSESQLYRIEISVYEFFTGYTAAHYGLFVAR